jgi:hypothetical protein
MPVRGTSSGRRRSGSRGGLDRAFCDELVLDIRVAVVEDGERLFDRPSHGSLAGESCIQDIGCSMSHRRRAQSSPRHVNVMTSSAGQMRDERRTAQSAQRSLTCASMWRESPSPHLDQGGDENSDEAFPLVVPRGCYSNSASRLKELRGLLNNGDALM